jgi:cytochrome b561
MPVMTQAARERYTTVAIVLHWLIALILISNFVLAWQFEDAKGLAKFELFQWHKSLGITVLVLSLVRLAWRLINPPPPPLASMKPWQQHASMAVHLGFYVIMIGMPMSGWLMVSASPRNIPTLLFGVINLPYLPFVHGLAVEQAKALAEAFSEAHEVMAWITYGLIGLHVGAALKHQFLDRDTIVSRMIPFLKRG